MAITLGNLVNAPRQCTGRSRLVRNPAYTPCKSISQWAQHHHLYSPNKPRIRLGAPGILRRTSSARRPERQTSRSSPPAPPSLALFASGGTHRRLATLCAEPELVVVAHPFVSCASISSAHRRRARPAVISPGRAPPPSNVSSVVAPRNVRPRRPADLRQLRNVRGGRARELCSSHLFARCRSRWAAAATRMHIRVWPSGRGELRADVTTPETCVAGCACSYWGPDSMLTAEKRYVAVRRTE